MPKFSGNLFSIVFLGRQNPQILNHDFLINHDILPTEIEPFKSVLENEEKPFSDHISTPVLTSISYGNISIVVEENRFQIRDTELKEVEKSPIIDITRKYFGEKLRFTPLSLGGINFAGVIEFNDKKDEESFDLNLGIDRERLKKITESDDIRLASKFSFPWEDGLVEIQINKSKYESQPSTFNFNYEFIRPDIDGFIDVLDDIGSINNKFKKILLDINLEQ